MTSIVSLSLSLLVYVQLQLKRMLESHGLCLQSCYRFNMDDPRRSGRFDLIFMALCTCILHFMLTGRVVWFLFSLFNLCYACRRRAWPRYNENTTTSRRPVWPSSFHVVSKNRNVNHRQWQADGSWKMSSTTAEQLNRCLYNGVVVIQYMVSVGEYTHNSFDPHTLSKARISESKDGKPFVSKTKILTLGVYDNWY